MAWTREFAFVFGTAELAVATVLAGYMAGLAAGAAAAGRLAARVRRPVRAYALLELGIALAALAVPWAIRAATPLYVALFGSGGTPAEAEGLPSALFHLACALAILVVPTGMMGATLPLLTRHAVREEREVGSRVGLLYAVNTAGAVLGAVGAGFLLLPALGLRQTIYVAAAGNLLVFALAAALAARAPLAPVLPRAQAPGRSRPAGWILPLALVSGLVSFVYEVLWTRLLSHVLGGSTYAFATMLAAFLAGIALGSAFAARAARRREAAAGGFALAQLGAAAGSWIAFRLVDGLPGLLGIGGDPASRLAGGAALAAATLLPAALCIGATFPFAVRLLARDEHEAARATGRVYAWNTFGAILGALLAAFWVLPALGFVRTLAAAVATNLGLALTAALLARPARRGLALVAAAALVALLAVPLAPPWELLLTSPLGGRAQGELAYVATGRSASVLLYQARGEWHLRSNGLPEASIQRPGGRMARYATAHWLGFLPVLARPDARRLLVVGLGGGLALETVPAGVERIDVVELEPEVVRANRAVAGARRRDPLADPRVALHVNDARGALVLMQGRYDAIVSQPSHPWTAGASHLYTREFFALARERLVPGGVLEQWMGIALLDPSLLRGLLATLLDVFPHVRVYAPVPGALLFLASDAPLELEASAGRALARQPELFARFGLLGSDDLLAALVFDEAGVRAAAQGAPLLTDDHNRLQTESPWIAGRGAAAMSRWIAAQPPPAAWSRAEDPVGLVARLLARRQDRRAEAFAATLAEPAQRHLAHALELASSRPAEARRQLERALALDPRAPRGRALSLLLANPSVADPSAPLPVAPPLSAAESALVSGWRAAEREDWKGLAALEPALAAVPPAHPLHESALLLRAAWRVEAGPEAAREALPLLEVVLARSPRPVAWLLRARAAARSGETVVVLESLEAVSGASERLSPAQRAEARAMLAELSVEDGLAAWRDAVARRVSTGSAGPG